jgi:ABC-type glycerol-3-phosphate transport system substrate-binding protein
MPLGIAGYSMYNMRSVAAPEIEGLWRMLPVPGTLKEDGTYDRTTTGGLTGLIVLKGVANRSAAFSFIDWYTGAQAQIDYGLAIENVFGQAGRYDTANLEALKQMNWTDRELASIEQQLQNIRMTPQIPASYYVTRSMTNAFRSVVISGQNPRESLYTYNKDMNEEIARKRLELGIDGRK